MRNNTPKAYNVNKKAKNVNYTNIHKDWSMPHLPLIFSKDVNTCV